MILAGDIGGTNCRLSLFSPDGTRLLRKETFPSMAFPSLEAVAKAFLGSTAEPVRAACFGIAGPVIDQRCVATNFPWIVDAKRVAAALDVGPVALINDLVALGFGALTLPENKFIVLRGDGPPKRGTGTLAVIAAGTGLGEAALVWDGTRLVPCATEGGHTDFAPRHALEFDLLAYLRRSHEHVSYERICSGPGIGTLYDFFVHAKKLKESKENRALLEQAADRNAVIAKLGLSGGSEPASRALDLFTQVFGAEAGNLALKTLSVGGVLVAGNIASSLRERMARGFLEAFDDKGRMRTLLERMPVAIVDDPDIGLAGSAAYAASGLVPREVVPTPRRRT